MDLTSTITDITAVGANMELVGIAVIGLAVIALSISWIKATFF